jgi:dUTPase
LFLYPIYIQMMEFKFTKVRDVQSPTRWTFRSSWLDFYIPNDIKPEDVKITPLNEPVKIDPSRFVTEDEVIIPWGRGMLIPSWLKVYMTPGSHDYVYDLVLIWKSWVSVKTDLIVWAAVIDNDYRWEFNLHLINPWMNDVHLKKWAKVIQWIIRQAEIPEIYEVDNAMYENFCNTTRWENWFWSTWE